MTAPDGIDLDEARARLEARRAELESIAAAGAEGRKPVELDQSRVGRLSRMDAMQDQAMALEAERRRNLELRRIAAALQRIDAGEYGYCAACGEAIAPKRLALDPTAPNCVDCAAG